MDRAPFLCCKGKDKGKIRLDYYTQGTTDAQADTKQKQQYCFPHVVPNAHTVMVEGRSGTAPVKKFS